MVRDFLLSSSDGGASPWLRQDCPAMNPSFQLFSLLETHFKGVASKSEDY